MFRVVVYAEGPGELAGFKSLQPAPGSPLIEEELGSAHLLVRRCLEKTRGLTADSVRFEEPLRSRNRLARGSILHSRDTLRPLLSWADPSKQPDLAIVLVDADGDDERQSLLDSAIEGVLVEAVVDKELLQEWCDQHARSRNAAEIRRDLARQCDLDTLAQRCVAFSSFLRKLQAPRT